MMNGHSKAHALISNKAGLFAKVFRTSNSIVTVCSIPTDPHGLRIVFIRSSYDLRRIVAYHDGQMTDLPELISNGLLIAD